MTDWYGKWLKPDPDKGGLLGADKLVLERPLGSQLARDWCWSGDQGLLYRALLDSGDPKLKACALEIAAALGALTDTRKMTTGILVESPETPRDFRVDYATGKGVLLRNLVFSSRLPPADLQTFIKNNAAAAWNNRLDTTRNRFGLNWSRQNVAKPLKPDSSHPQGLIDIVMHAAGQDAMNSARLVTTAEDSIPGS